MKLYYTSGTCARACWIALEWAGLDYEAIKVDYRSDDYKKINPLGMVPALELSDGQILTQAGAILNYISDLAPEKDLAADDTAVDRARFNEIMDFLSGDFHPAFWPVFTPERYTTSKKPEVIQEAKEAAYLRVDLVMQHLDGLIGGTNHVYKDKKNRCRRLCLYYGTLGC
ncbi:glutathione S-transferase [Streptococcus sp. X16XC17]|uniref:glutathione S-transferase family protein n=1 Tax=Streptococcus sp. X16XC17 TaxID=2316646 RepID=UPI001F0EDB24|nr:glutathione S-transferase [Streptococcus sp. X16XC17]